MRRGIRPKQQGRQRRRESAGRNKITAALALETGRSHDQVLLPGLLELHKFPDWILEKPKMMRMACRLLLLHLIGQGIKQTKEDGKEETRGKVKKVKKGKSEKGKGKGSKKGKSKGQNPCFTMMNKGACDKVDCPYSHDEKFIAASKAWYDELERLEEQNAAFQGGAERGRGAFVALRVAMPAVTSSDLN